MKKQKNRKLLFIKSKVAQLRNSSLILGGDDGGNGDGGLTTETGPKKQMKCIKTSLEWVPVVVDE